MTNKPKHPSIATKPIKSSQIAEIGHHGDILCVKFHGGGCYHYHGVSADVFEQMQKAESAGKFLSSNIKGKFKFEKVS